MPETGNTLTLETTQGQVVIDMRPDLAPAHVAHIKKLVGEKFYDGIVFHRVMEGFMAQTGCPHGTGTGGSKYRNLNAEFNAEPHVRGTCSMARARPRDARSPDGLARNWEPSNLCPPIRNHRAERCRRGDFGRFRHWAL